MNIYREEIGGQDNAVVSLATIIEGLGDVDKAAVQSIVKRLCETNGTVASEYGSGRRARWTAVEYRYPIDGLLISLARYHEREAGEIRAHDFPDTPATIPEAVQQYEDGTRYLVKDKRMDAKALVASVGKLRDAVAARAYRLIYNMHIVSWNAAFYQARDLEESAT